MHFAVHFEPGGALLQDGQHFAHLDRRGMVGGAEVGVAQQRHLGHDAEALDFLRGHDGELGNAFGAGVVVDVGVDDEDLLLGQQQSVHGGIALHAGLEPDHLLDVLQVHGRAAPGAADHAVGIALVHHHGSDQHQAAAHLDLGHGDGHAFAGSHLVIGLPEVAVALVVLDVDHVIVLALAQAQAELLDAPGNDGRASDQNRAGQPLVHHDLHGAQHALFFALGVDHAFLGGHAGDGEDGLHGRARGVDEALQLLLVLGHVLDRARSHARVHGGLRHRRCDLDHEPRIERLGNQVLGAEGEVLPHIGSGHHFALLGLGQLGNGVHGRDFHLVGDDGGPAVQGAAEDVGEAQDVVDLVRVVGAARGHDGIVPHLADFLGLDLGGGVGQRKDERIGRHTGHHLGLEHAARRQSQEHVRALDGLAERAQVGALHELGLVIIHELGAALVDQPGQIRHPDVPAGQAQLDEQVDAGQRGRAGAARDDLDVFELLAHDLEAVEHGGTHHDGGAVLVVVEDRNLHALAQLALDDEAVRCLDVLQVDAPEGGLQCRDDLDEAVRILFVDLDVEHVDAGELLEQDALALHHGLAGERADVAQPQHGRAVGDHAHQVAAGRVAEGCGGILHDLLAGRGHAGRIGQCQIMLVDHLLGRLDADLAGAGQLVVVERSLAQLGMAIGRRVGVAGGNLGGHGGSPCVLVWLVARCDCHCRRLVLLGRPRISGRVRRAAPGAWDGQGALQGRRAPHGP